MQKYPDKSISNQLIYEQMQEVGDWLDQFEWHGWFTGTFRFPVIDPDDATMYFRRWIKRILKFAGGVRWALTVEPHPRSLPPRYHVHALLYFAQRPKNLAPFIQRWRWSYGRALLHVYNPDRAARFYLGRQLSEGSTRDVHFDFGEDGNLRMNSESRVHTCGLYRDVLRRCGGRWRVPWTGASSPGQLVPFVWKADQFGQEVA